MRKSEEPSSRRRRFQFNLILLMTIISAFYVVNHSYKASTTNTTLVDLINKNNRDRMQYAERADEQEEIFTRDRDPVSLTFVVIETEKSLQLLFMRLQQHQVLPERRWLEIQRAMNEKFDASHIGNYFAPCVHNMREESNVKRASFHCLYEHLNVTAFNIELIQPLSIPNEADIQVMVVVIKHTQLNFSRLVADKNVIITSFIELKSKSDLLEQVLFKDDIFISQLQSKLKPWILTTGKTAVQCFGN